MIRCSNRSISREPRDPIKSSFPTVGCRVSSERHTVSPMEEEVSSQQNIQRRRRGSCAVGLPTDCSVVHQHLQTQKQPRAGERRGVQARQKLLHPRIISHPRTFFSFERNTHAHTSTARRTPRTLNACGKPPTRSKQQGERATQQSAARLTKKQKVKPAIP